MKLQDLVKGFQALPSQKRFLAVVVFLSTLGGLILFAVLAGRPDYGVLYANLAEEDAGKVIAELQKRRIPYRTEADGRVILVPRESVYETRLALAAQGISRGGVVGFEIFDQESWTSSRFVQEVNYRRALQGELARTIMSIEEVEGARVHLVIPPKSPFVGSGEDRPKASVVLKMRGGRRLDPSRVRGIVYLVAGSVDGLSPDDVSVIDTEGTLLTAAAKPEEDFGAISSQQLEYKSALEDKLEERVTQMLEKVVGPGKAVVRVSADVDFRKVEKQEELFDPDSAVVRSEQKRSERVGAEAAGVSPGLDANVPGRIPGTGSQESAPSELKEQTLNYEINKVVRRMVESPGAIRRLSVAVLLHKDDRTEEGEIERISSIVKGAVGFDAQRGDQVEVAFLPFETNATGADLEAPPAGLLERIQGLLPYALKYGGLLIGVALLIFAGLRPMLRVLAEAGAKAQREPREEFPQALAEAEHALPESKSDRQRLVERVREDPAKAAQVVRMWLREG